MPTLHVYSWHFSGPPEQCSASLDLSYYLQLEIMTRKRGVGSSDIERKLGSHRESSSSIGKRWWNCMVYMPPSSVISADRWPTLDRTSMIVWRSSESFRSNIFARGGPCLFQRCGAYPWRRNCFGTTFFHLMFWPSEQFVRNKLTTGGMVED